MMQAPPSSTTAQLGLVFQNFHTTLEQEQQIREEIRKVVKDLDASVRKISTSMQQIHNPKGLKRALYIFLIYFTLFELCF